MQLDEDHLKPGAVLDGVVAKTTEYGAYVDVGELYGRSLEGLLLLHEMSWGRVTRVSDVLETGQPIKAVVRDFDPDARNLLLSYKRLTPDPWEAVTSRYPVDSRVTRRVSSLVEYGAFVALEEGLEGLIHVSAMGSPERDPETDRRAVSPADLLSSGEEVSCVVLSVEPELRRIRLGLAR